MWEYKKTDIFPRVFRMNSDIALPKSVEIRALANGSIKNNKSKLENLSRSQRFGFFDKKNLPVILNFYFDRLTQCDVMRKENWLTQVFHK